MEKRQNEVIEIDLLELFYALKKQILWIILAAIVGGTLAFAGTKLLMTPMYESTTTMLVLTKETTLSSLADLQMGTQLTNDYEILTVSRQVLERVIDDLNLDMEYEDLKDSVQIGNPSDSRIMEITVTYPSPKMAKEIVDDIAAVTSEFIGDKMEGVPPKIIDEGEVPDHKSSPSTMKNTALGILLGIVISCGVVTLYTVMDDTVKSEEDIEKYLGIPTLASVPDRKDYITGKKKENEEKQTGQKAVAGGETDGIR